MRKVIACLVVLVLLCAMAGCGLFERQREAAPEAATEITTEVIVTEEPTAAMPEGYFWASFYAVTPTHFYTASQRVPLNNINKKEPVPWPEKHNGKDIYGVTSICGITPEWIYLCMIIDDGRAIYRISLETGESEFVTEVHGSAWLNAGSNSLLLLIYNSDMQGHYDIHLEALDLSTGKTSVIYEDFYCDPWSDIWFNLEDGTIVLSECRLRIDAANQVKEEADIEWDSWRYQPQTEAEKSLQENREIVTYAPWNGWLYYVERTDWEAPKNLYRMKPDGTGKELLRAKTNIRQLMEANGKLFALAAYPQADSDFGVENILLHELGVDGKPLWNKDGGSDNENRGTGMWRVGDMVMVYYGIMGGGYGEYFYLLYDPATGQTLEGKK